MCEEPPPVAAVVKRNQRTPAVEPTAETLPSDTGDGDGRSCLRDIQFVFIETSETAEPLAAAPAL